jgi:hypothetical protein
MLTSLEVPTAWKPEARHQALVNLLQMCRDTAWSLDPRASRGLVHHERTELFRLVEQLATSSSAGASAPAQLLSASEQAEFRSSLAAAGYSHSDVVHTQGRWSLGSGGRPLPAPTWSTGTAGSALKIETKLRTLYIQPYALLTAAERKDQATRTKTTPAKRRAAFPGDEDLEPPDSVLNSFSEWPWEQSLRLAPDHPYKRAGRLLRNMLRWCNKYCTCPIMNMTFATRSAAANDIFDKFMEAVPTGRQDIALLVAMQATAEAAEQMKCILVNAQLRAAEHSSSAMLAYIAIRRQAQSDELCVFLVEVNNRITEASRARHAAAGGATASWIDFISGWLSKIDTDLVEPDSLVQAATTAPPSSASATASTPRQTVSPGNTPRAAKTVTFASPSGGIGSGGAGREGSSWAGSGGSGGGAASPGPVKPWKACVFKLSILFSPDVVGDSLGVLGAPPCTKCARGNHFPAECPLAWGASGTPLPGFADDGQRLADAWSNSSNEPVRKVIKAWVAFLGDHSNFHNKPPTVAGVAGAPDLAQFKVREPLAHKKP